MRHFFAIITASVLNTCGAGENEFAQAKRLSEKHFLKCFEERKTCQYAARHISDKCGYFTERKPTSEELTAALALCQEKHCNCVNNTTEECRLREEKKKQPPSTPAPLPDITLTPLPPPPFSRWKERSCDNEEKYKDCPGKRRACEEARSFDEAVERKRVEEWQKHDFCRGNYNSCLEERAQQWLKDCKSRYKAGVDSRGVYGNCISGVEREVIRCRHVHCVCHTGRNGVCPGGMNPKPNLVIYPADTDTPGRGNFIVVTNFVL